MFPVQTIIFIVEKKLTNIWIVRIHAFNLTQKRFFSANKWPKSPQIGKFEWHVPHSAFGCPFKLCAIFFVLCTSPSENVEHRSAFTSYAVLSPHSFSHCPWHTWSVVRICKSLTLYVKWTFLYCLGPWPDWVDGVLQQNRRWNGQRRSKTWRQVYYLSCYTFCSVFTICTYWLGSTWFIEIHL